MGNFGKSEKNSEQVLRDLRSNTEIQQRQNNTTTKKEAKNGASSSNTVRDIGRHNQFKKKP